MVFDAYGRKGRWINTLQDFNFKIVHKARSRHTNVDALSRNLINVIKVDEDLVNEIQDYKLLQAIQQLGETIWIGRNNSKMGLLLQ
jgi:hypothetical protein